MVVRCRSGYFDVITAEHKQRGKHGQTDEITANQETNGADGLQLELLQQVYGFYLGI